ncbi:MAG: dTMP kinase [Gammaproteobacteria bacterium]
MTARFITIEGIEGAGKTTSINFISHYIENKGKKLVTTREPGGTELGEQVRALLLSHRLNAMTADTETLLMFAARAQHLHQVIRPALAAGHWVLSDRFTDASYAYQGGGRGISAERIAVLEDWVQDGLRPDLTLLMDLPAALGLQRAHRRSLPDRFESEQLAFFERVREAYLGQAQRHPHRYRVIDASQPLDAVRQQIAQALDSFFS